MQFQTFIHCRIPRAECRIHGARTITVAWSEPSSHWALEFGDFAVFVMEQVSTLVKAASILGISWDEASRLRDREVERGLRRRTVEEIEYLGIDEKSFGRKEMFITVLADPQVSGQTVRSSDYRWGKEQPSCDRHIHAELRSFIDCNNPEHHP